MRYRSRLILAFGVLYAACGDDDRQSFTDAAASDAGGDAILSDELRAFSSSYSGAYTTTYNFLDTVTLETFRPDPAVLMVAMISSNEDNTVVDVQFGSCSGIATFTNFDDSTGERVQRYASEQADCELVINGHTVVFSDPRMTVFWGENRFRVSVSGYGSIPNSDSLMIFEFDTAI